MKLTIDNREGTRIEQAKKYYKDNPEITDTSIGQLPIGDYIFTNNNNEQVCFEYKTMQDFISSILDNRVFNQTIKMFEKYGSNQFVILEGTEDDRKAEMKKINIIAHKQNRPYLGLSKKQYVGACSSLCCYTHILQVPNMEDAFERMLKQAEKCFDNHFLTMKYKKSTGNGAYRLLCHVCDGVSNELGMRIVNTLGLVTVTDVLSLSYDELVSVRGVGDKIASSILDQLK